MGRGTKTDKEQALYWFTKAADASNPVAQANLAMMYLSADGVSKDVEKAIVLFTKAAEQNNLPSMLRLADLYGKGNETSLNLRISENLVT